MSSLEREIERLDIARRMASKNPRPRGDPMTHQESFATPRDMPSCELHHETMPTWCVMPPDSMGTWHAQFTCAHKGCSYTVRAACPQCDVCLTPMQLKETKSGQLYWQCEAHKRSEVFEPCDACLGTGWLHMESSGYPPLPGVVFIGHDGAHIESCDNCTGRRLFKDDVQAELAHRKECGCGHGLPDGKRFYRWVDYPGRQGELLAAFALAGFDTKTLCYEVVRVDIPPEKAVLFVQVLDATYRGMTAPHPEASQTTSSWRTETMREDEKMKPPLPIPYPPRRHSKNEASAQSPWSPSRFTIEQIRQSGCEPVTTNGMANSPLKVDRDGFPICVLRTVLPKGLVDLDLTAVERERGAAQEIAKAAYALLSQLNEMNFQDHPRSEALRLESRRRGLLRALRDAEGDKKEGRDSMGGDFHASRMKEHMVTAGGFKFDKLEKGDDEDVVHGSIHMDGHYFRVVAVRVQDLDREQVPVNDPNNWYSDLVGRFNDEYMSTVKLDGFPGEYVILIYPGGV